VTARRFIADHIAGIGSSGIRRMFDIGATLTDPINLSIGQPDYPVPESVKAAIRSEARRRVCRSRVECSYA